MVMTLVEASKLHSGDVVRSGVIEMFARQSEILRVIPFDDISGLSYTYMTEGRLPGIAFRGINQAFAESVGIVTPMTEVLRIAGGDLDVDKVIIDTMGEDVRTRHEMMKVKALSLYIGKKMLKGDSLTSNLEFDGLQNRITGTQLVAAGSTNGGDALSLFKLDQAIAACDYPTHLIMPRDMMLRLTQAARNTAVGGFITYSKDEFGRHVTNYNGIPILVLDHDEEGARVLAFDEVGPGGATATCGSIYVVNFSEGMIMGLQNGVMQVRDLGEIDAKPVWRTRVDWNVGLCTMHPRCAVRLWGISNAAVVV